MNIDIDISALRDEFELRLKQEGINASSGYTFDEYFQEMMADNPPETISQLKKRVGGEFFRAKSAFNVITAASSNKTTAVNPIPSWYDDMCKTLISSLEDTMKGAWPQFDDTIRKSVQSHTALNEATISEVRKLNADLELIIDDLEASIRDSDRHVASLQEEIGQLSSRKETCIKYEVQINTYAQRVQELKNELAEKDKMINGLHAKLADATCTLPHTIHASEDASLYDDYFPDRENDLDDAPDLACISTDNNETSETGGSDSDE